MANTISRTFPKAYVYTLLTADFTAVETVTLDHELKSKKEKNELLSSYIGAEHIVCAEIVEETREMSVEDFIKHSTVK